MEGQDKDTVNYFRLLAVCPEDAVLHVTPYGKLEPVHEQKISCWCEPELFYLDEFTNREIWMHRSRH